MTTTTLDHAGTATATALPPRLPLSFTLDDAHAAHEPPEARGTARDGVRLMVSNGNHEPIDTTFTALPARLMPGDLVVVNTSGTVAAAIDGTLVTPSSRNRSTLTSSSRNRSTSGDDTAVVLHVSSELPGDLWMVEARRTTANGSTEPRRLAPKPTDVRLVDGTVVHLLRPAPHSERLWLAVVDAGESLHDAMAHVGRPIRYRYVPRDWPLAAYQTVFATEPGSAEMPSAARPFTTDVVTRLVTHGIAIAPLTLHTGVSSLEGDELPYPERFRVPAATARAVNSAHAAGNHVIAVGTTVVRALETATDAAGVTHPADGWTEEIITPARGVRAVDGLLTGWHAPEATHLAMLEAVAGRDALVRAYEHAFEQGYKWHEFGDSHLLLPYAG
jgi:S-adenosylmethionine:tRNA ribosyltransferase-isomerase